MKNKVSAYKNPYRKLKPEIKKPYTVLYLIRHGNPDYGLENAVGDFNMPLSNIGQTQTKLLTKRLLTLGIEKIYASELLRAQETARPLATKLNKKVIIDERLNEIDWRDWHRIKYFNTSELSRKENFKEYKKLDKRLDKHQAEARALVAEVYKHSRGKIVAAFCHGNIIKTIITSILDADIIGFLSLEIFQSSVSKLVIDSDGYVKINYINNIGHLPHEPNEDLFITLVD